VSSPGTEPNRDNWTCDRDVRFILPSASSSSSSLSWLETSACLNAVSQAWHHIQAPLQCSIPLQLHARPPPSLLGESKSDNDEYFPWCGVWFRKVIGVHSRSLFLFSAPYPSSSNPKQRCVSLAIPASEREIPVIKFAVTLTCPHHPTSIASRSTV
jgi:hypothetical protein